MQTALMSTLFLKDTLPVSFQFYFLSKAVFFHTGNVIANPFVISALKEIRVLRCVLPMKNCANIATVFDRVSTACTTQEQMAT